MTCVTGSQPWGNVAEGTASVKALRHSELDVFKAQEEGGTFVSGSEEAGETSKVS